MISFNSALIIATYSIKAYLDSFLLVDLEERLIKTSLNHISPDFSYGAALLDSSVIKLLRAFHQEMKFKKIRQPLIILS